MRRTILLSLLTGLTLTLAGCEFDPTEWGDSDRYKEDFSSTHKLASGGKITLESFNGAVEVLGWDREEVEVAGTKYASRESVMKDIKIDVTSDPTWLRVRAIRPVDHNCNCGARFTLKVPRKAALDLIQTSNGAIRVESITGDSRLKTSNGSVKIWSVQGRLEASTSNGGVEIGKYEGNADVRTSNGRIKADGIKGSFEGKTSNGSIDVSIADLEAGRPLILSSSNGSVNLALDNWKNNEIRVSTSNSSVNVRLPEKVSAELRASTSNGNITTDYEITTSQFSKTRVAGKIGGGGALIDLSTTNGNVRLMKR